MEDMNYVYQVGLFCKNNRYEARKGGANLIETIVKDMKLKLDYFDLISPDPVPIQNIGHLLSPTLSQLSKVGIHVYHYYLSIILMTPEMFFTMLKQKEQFDNLSDEEKEALNVFDLFISNEETKELLRKILDFFIIEDIIFYEPYNCFILSNDVSNIQEHIVGIINRENYGALCDLICQLNNIKSKQIEDLSKAKGKAFEILKKIQEGRKEKQKNSKLDKNMELGNVISAVANKHPSLNMANIWNLTVFQLWDTFSRLTNNSIYDIQSMSVAAWGDKENHFDATAWFRRIDTEK